MDEEERKLIKLQLKKLKDKMSFEYLAQLDRQYPERRKERQKKYGQTPKGKTTRKKYSQSKKGRNIRERARAKRRELGFDFLNEPFAGAVGHHIDKECIIYIPYELHYSIWHNVWTGSGMAEINDKAFEWLVEHGQI